MRKTVCYKENIWRHGAVERWPVDRRPPRLEGPPEA